jgi:hypothetical protein
MPKITSWKCFYLIFYQCVLYQCFSLFLSGKFPKIRNRCGNRPRNSLTSAERQKKVEHFQPTRKEKIITSDSCLTAELCIGLHFCSWEWESLFSGNENVRTSKIHFFSENKNVRTRTTFFSRERKQESRKVALVALMIRYVNLVAKSDENHRQLLVALIQVSHAVLHYF